MRQPIRDRIARSIGVSRAEAFLRTDFADFGSYAQVGKALNALVRDGRLVRIGYGVYAKAEPSILSGKPIPRAPLETIAAQTFRKLGVAVQPGRAQREYLAGSQQIPMQVSYDTGRRRITRKLRVGGLQVRYENDLR